MYELLQCGLRRRVARENQSNSRIRRLDHTRDDQVSLIPRRALALAPSTLSQCPWHAKKKVCTTAGAFLGLGFDLHRVAGAAERPIRRVTIYRGEKKQRH